MSIWSVLSGTVATSVENGIAGGGPGCAHPARIARARARSEMRVVRLRLAARLVLLAAVGDGLDGIVARRVGGTPAGEYLDSLSDVAAFGVAPAVLVTTLALDGRGLDPDALPVRTALAVGVPALFLGMTVVRLGLYTAYDAKASYTEGAPGTLAATVIAAAVLAGAVGPAILVGVAALLSYLMVTRIRYPDLLPLDALLMGVVQGLAILFPDIFGRAFPYAVLTLAVTYLVLAPRFYWGWK